MVSWQAAGYTPGVGFRRIFLRPIEPILSERATLTYLMSQHDRLNDELLVLRCQEGDAEAFELLVGRWQRQLWRHAWRLTGDEGTAWDVVQETWIGISRGIARLADASAFPAWAYQIVSNKCRRLGSP